VDIKKLALIATFAFVITGIVVYQVRSTRKSSRVTTSTEGNSAAAPAPSVPEIPQSSLPRVSAAEVQGEAPRPAVEPRVLSIPTKGWGRSPFLTVEEIARLNLPREPAPVDAPVTAPPVVEALPQYIYSGRSQSRDDAIAFIGKGKYRIGDRIGTEVVKEITEDSVVLESNGKRRKLFRNTKPGG